MTVKRRMLAGGKREEQKCHEPRAMRMRSSRRAVRGGCEDGTGSGNLRNVRIRQFVRTIARLLGWSDFFGRLCEIDPRSPGRRFVWARFDGRRPLGRGWRVGLFLGPRLLS